MLQVQPVPVAAVGVRPAGSPSVTVTSVPSVATPPLFVAVKMKLPEDPRTRVEALAVLVRVRSVGSAVLTVTEPVAGVLSPPPLTEAVFVREFVAFEATVAAIREFRYDSAFLFKYSARPDTRSHRWPAAPG